jgi:prefoldin subunit 5
MEVLPEEVKSVLLDLVEQIDNSVKKEDFDDLKGIVKELAEAQKRTEDRLFSLTVKVEELAEAQKKTEERLDSLTLRVEELAEAQKKTEERLDSLTLRVEELAEAQKKTEERLDSLTLRVEELAEAQKKTEERLDSLTLRIEELAEAQKKTEERLDSLTLRVEELAEAQKRTEESLNKLIKRVDNIEVQLGGLSMAVGYGIEDRLYPKLKRFIKGHFSATPTNVVLRHHINYGNGKFDEVNLYCEALKDDKKVYFIGECKAQPGKRDILKFMEMIKRLKNSLLTDIYPFIVGYTYHPEVEDFIRERFPEISYFKTYEIEYYGEE